MKDFLLKTFKDKKQVFIFVTILLVAFTTFSLLNALLTEEGVEEPVDMVNSNPTVPPGYRYDPVTGDIYPVSPDTEPDIEEEEEMIAPLEDYTIISKFYDMNASEEERLNSLIVYNNMIQNNVTTNFKSTTDEVFDVLAVFSGTVSKVNSTLLYGNMIEMIHDNGVTTTYYSLGDLMVEVDDEIEQGDVIATAGTCEIDAENGIQVRLRVQKDGKNVNPETYLGTKISEIN
ncbi:M23 family metallopeptidase [Mycoplasmatota bacterium]|nr:M23 family metallopeptidase [Mycoplasmatota bacterium]